MNPKYFTSIYVRGLPFSSAFKYITWITFLLILSFKEYGVKEDELQGILNYLLTTHEVNKLATCFQEAFE